MDSPCKKQYQEENQEQSRGQQMTEQLPQIDPPSEQSHPRFFKVKTRITQEHLNVQIGLLVVKYQYFQEDFVTYLANLLMCEVEFLNIFIVDPLHLYISMNAATNEGVTHFDYIQLEANIYALLLYCQETIMKFLGTNVSQNEIFKENGCESEELIKRFQEDVVKRVNERHEKLFGAEESGW